MWALNMDNPCPKAKSLSKAALRANDISTTSTRCNHVHMIEACCVLNPDQMLCEYHFSEETVWWTEFFIVF